MSLPDVPDVLPALQPDLKPTASPDLQASEQPELQPDEQPDEHTDTQAELPPYQKAPPKFKIWNMSQLKLSDIRLSNKTLMMGVQVPRKRLRLHDDADVGAAARANAYVVEDSEDEGNVSDADVKDVQVAENENGGNEDDRESIDEDDHKEEEEEEEKDTRRSTRRLRRKSKDSDTPLKGSDKTNDNKRVLRTRNVNGTVSSPATAASATKGSQARNTPARNTQSRTASSSARHTPSRKQTDDSTTTVRNARGRTPRSVARASIASAQAGARSAPSTPAGRPKRTISAKQTPSTEVKRTSSRIASAAKSISKSKSAPVSPANTRKKAAVTSKQGKQTRRPVRHSRAETSDESADENGDDDDEANDYDKSDESGVDDTEEEEEDSEMESESEEEEDEKPTLKRKRGRQPAPTKAVSKKPSAKHTPSKKHLLLKYTPSKQARASKDPTPLPLRQQSRIIPQSDMDRVRENLHVSAVPDNLPCRENELESIYTHLYSSIDNGGGECIYISGVPGTGKTASVRQVVRTLQNDVESGSLQDFQFIEVNGMKVTDPSQVYSTFWAALNPDSPKVSPLHAASLLTQFFKNPTPNRSTKPIVFLIDELDLLVTKKQTVIYNLFDWPRTPSSPLIVVAIANTMDLPERMFTHKINSRVGAKRINFNAYGVNELKEIIKSRLMETGVVSDDAIEFCARKVAGMSGDARRSLDICRRAIEVLQQKHRDDPSIPTLVTRQMIAAVISELFTSPTISMLTRLPLHFQIFLLAIHKVVRKEGLSEVGFIDVCITYTDISNALSVVPLDTSGLNRIASRMYAMRLIILESGKWTDPGQRVKLNVLDNELIGGLGKDTRFERFLER
ncbi:Origin recognition complex, subunit 1 [Chytridiales sp. JEL 0842]|nr:Origin recognition complex, subunit 1 [Chytridiales sp. JEL 0842]